MIHQLIVDQTLSPEKLKKLSRRYAMTGGYELQLSSGLDEQQVGELVKWYLPIALSFSPEVATFRSNNAYRILKMLRKHPATSESVRLKLDNVLFCK